jgi:hypothetical protein
LFFAGGGQDDAFEFTSASEAKKFDTVEIVRPWGVFDVESLAATLDAPVRATQVKPVTFKCKGQSREFAR